MEKTIVSPNTKKKKRASPHTLKATKGQLCEFLRGELADRPSVTKRKVLELLVRARREIRQSYSKPRPDRLSRVASNLKRFAESLDTACHALQKGGDQAVTLISVIADRDPGVRTSLSRHIAFLEQFRDVAREAATLAHDHSRSMLQARRGRMRDENFEVLILKLMHLYKEVYTGKFLITVDVNDGRIKTGVTQFVKLVMAAYAPNKSIGEFNVERIV